MLGSRLILRAIGAVVTVGVAIAVTAVFRDEIADFVVDVKNRIDEKKKNCNCESEDYIDA